MVRRAFAPEQIINTLPEAEVLLSQGSPSDTHTGVSRIAKLLHSAAATFSS